MISWTDEAIEAALDVWEARIYRTTSWKQDVRDMLDAAVRAQGCILLDRDDEAHHARSYEKGRAEALEEAARVADNVYCGTCGLPQRTAAAIRALKEKQG